MDEIVTALLSHEQRRKNNLSEDPSGGAFVVRGDHNAENKKGNKKKRGCSAISGRDGDIKRLSVRK